MKHPMKPPEPTDDSFFAGDGDVLVVDVLARPSMSRDEADSKLSQLHADIDARVQAIREDRPDWLCGKGCDSCCQRLAEVPSLTEMEWNFLREGLDLMSPERILEIKRDMAALARQQSRPIVCPLLDRTTAVCRVYTQRPVACRTYGFYVQRDLGLYCRDIESRVTDGVLADVVWGNHDAIDHRLAGLGEIRPLTEWFDRYQTRATLLRASSMRPRAKAKGSM